MTNESTVSREIRCDLQTQQRSRGDENDRRGQQREQTAPEPDLNTEQSENQGEMFDNNKQKTWSLKRKKRTQMQ